MKQGKVWLFLAAAALAATVALGQPRAQDLTRIAAVVNDDVISMKDFRERLQMVTVMSRLPRTPEVQRRLAPEVLRTLIDEKLKLQEAGRLSLAVTDDEFNRAMATLESRNNMAPGTMEQVLADQGIPYASLAQQVRATLAWNKVVNQRIWPTIRISGEEIQEALTRMRENLGQPSYLVSEIFIGIDTPDQEDSVRAFAERLVQQIGEGTDFAELARQFSHAATAAVGGDAGWIQLGDSEPEIDKALGGMKPGQLLGPIRTIRGYHILLLRDVRTAEKTKPEDVKVSIAQVVLGYPPNAQDVDIANQKSIARTVSETASGCADMSKIGKEIGATTNTMLDDVKVGDLAENIRPLAVSLEVGKASQPVDLKSGVAVIMVCEREDSPNLPKPQEMRERIGQQRLGLLTRRYLRDLRRAAFLDVRV